MDIVLLLSNFFSQLWEIIVLIANVVTWVFTTEERLALWMSHNHWDIPSRIVVLSVMNMAIIGVDYLIISIAKRVSVRVRKLRTPKILRRITKGKPISYIDLFMFAATPFMQKFGVIAFHARRRRLRWKGFLALAMGGVTRVTFYPLLGKWIIVLIVGMIIARIFEWQQQNGNFEKFRNSISK